MDDVDVDDSPAALVRDLAALRIAAGEPSYSSLAKRTGFGRSTVHEALTGERMPSQDLTVAIATALGADGEAWRRRWTAVRSTDTRRAEPTPVNPPDSGTPSGGHRKTLVAAGAGAVVAAGVTVGCVLAFSGSSKAPSSTAGCVQMRSYKVIGHGDVLDTQRHHLGSIEAGDTVYVKSVDDRGGYTSRYFAQVPSAHTSGYVDIQKLDFTGTTCAP